MVDLPQIAFEWFVSLVWDRHGPLVVMMAVALLVWCGLHPGV